MPEKRYTHIHLGLPKTATTCFQTHLFANHSQIHCFGKYPGMGTVSPTVRPALLSNFERIVEFDSDDIRMASIEKQLAHAMENSLTPVLSKEGLAGGSIEKKQEQARSFVKHFGPCKAIFLIREPSSFIKSFYVQMLKGFHKDRAVKPDWMIALGKPPRYFDINEWLETAWDSNNSPRNFLSYADTAEAYASVFGQENVLIYLFEEFVQNPAQFVTKLCHDLNIDAEEGFRLIDGKRANDRITTDYTERIKTLEKSPLRSFLFRKSSAEKKWKLLNSGTSSGEKIDPQISASWLKQIHAVSENQNRRLVNEWGIPLADYGYRV